MLQPDQMYWNRHLERQRLLHIPINCLVTPLFLQEMYNCCTNRFTDLLNENVGVDHTIGLSLNESF